MTLQDRVDAYKAAIPEFPDSAPVVSPSGRWLTGVWLLGNDYKGSGYYGAYPPSFLRRVASLFPEVSRDRWLHLFSGSLSSDVPGIRVDLMTAATVRADAKELPFADGVIPLTAADPPYTPADAERYGTLGVNKRLVLKEIARATTLGGHLVWLDTTLPMYAKKDWHHWGMICVQRSTNHRTRLCSLFTRVG